MRMIIVILIFVFANGYAYGWAVTDYCGIDKSNAAVVYEGNAEIETYPWMGLLMYPYGVRGVEPKTSAVVLITPKLVLTTALEIDKYPKHDFRRNSRIVLGHNCSGPFIRIMEYVFHPEFGMKYYSSLAMLQIQTIPVQEYLHICAPPNEFEHLELFAMTVTLDCSTPMIKIYKMKYVPLNHCKEYYRRNDLDVDSLWPKYTSCAQGVRGTNCLWRSGTVLVTKQNGQWRLLGVGIYGPGCAAPARFLDYDMYHGWVEQSTARIGKVAVTRMSPNHLILRRSATTLQRYGPCDPEETQVEIYTDFTQIMPHIGLSHFADGIARYNLTLYAQMEYSCVILRIYSQGLNATNYTHTIDNTEIRLKKMCRAKTPLCAQDSYITIYFYVEILFRQTVTYKVSAFGTEFKQIDAKILLFLTNQPRRRPEIPWPSPWQTKDEWVEIY